MRIDALTVALRPRSAWEAVELGTALARRHARAVWTPWLLVTIAAFVAVNAVMAALDVIWLAALLMWWLKPLFARLPLFVLSRAVFGDVPDTRATLRGAFRGAGRATLGYLTWRRLSPARALLMPVDVLEGGPAQHAAARRRAVAGPAYGVAALTWIVFFHFEAAVAFAIGMLAFLFVPEEHLMGSLRRAWVFITEAPTWLLLVQNALAWAATALLEPFHVGAGFGLYLNRRTEIEGWDIELAFRRLRARLQAAANVAMLAIVLLAIAPHARADDAPARAPSCPAPVQAPPVATLDGAFVAPDRFDRAVEQAYADARIDPHRQATVWKPRDKPDETPETGPLPEWLSGLLGGLGTAAELVLWALAALLVGLLIWTARRWWPWLRGLATPAPLKPVAPRESELAVAEPLPADIAGTARRLWNAGQAREALALVYRAAVEAMVTSTGRALPPGATEAQCLRAAAALPDAPRRAFAHSVRLWQQAAYAERLPAQDAFDAMLADAAQQFGWAR